MNWVFCWITTAPAFKWGLLISSSLCLFFLCYSLTAISDLTRAAYFKAFDPKSSYSCKLSLVTPEVSLKYWIRKIMCINVWSTREYSIPQSELLFSKTIVFGGENKTVWKHKNIIQQYFMGKHFIFSFRARYSEDNLCQGKVSESLHVCVYIYLSKFPKKSHQFCKAFIKTGLHLYTISDIIRKAIQFSQLTFGVPTRYSKSSLTPATSLIFQQWYWL